MTISRLSLSSYHRLGRWFIINLIWCQLKCDKSLSGFRRSVINHGRTYCVRIHITAPIPCIIHARPTLELRASPATRHKWTQHALKSARQSGCRLTYPAGTESWVDLDGLHMYINESNEIVYVSEDSHCIQVVGRPDVYELVYVYRDQCTINRVNPPTH